MPQDLVGAAEIAEMLGVTRQHVDRLARDDPDFPVPVAQLKGGRVWFRLDIEQWAERHRRPRGRPPRPG